MLRCQTGWPRIDELKRTSMEALWLPPGWVKQEDASGKGALAADFMLVSNRGRRYAVVIESFERVRFLSSSRRQVLCWRGGMPILPDPIERMVKMATRTRATPVLWLPRARLGVFDVKTATWPGMVVRGPARVLENVLFFSAPG